MTFVPPVPVGGDSPDLPPQPTPAVPIPVLFNTGASLTVDQIAAVAFQAGLRGDPLATAVAISCAEDTDHDPTSLNNDPATGDYSVGLWQINFYGNLYSSRVAQFGLPPVLTDPQLNANAMYQLSGGGVNFTPWTTFKDTSYQQYLAQAYISAQNAATAASNSPAGQSYLLPPAAPIAGGGSGTGNTFLTALNSLTVPLVDPPVAYKAPGDDIVSRPPYDPGSLSLPNGTQIGNWVILGGQASLTVSDVSEITFTLADPGLVLFNTLNFSLDDWIMWQAFPWMISSVQIDQLDNGLEGSSLVVRSAGAELFKTQRSGPFGGSVVQMLEQCAGLPMPGTGGDRGPLYTPSQFSPPSLTNAAFGVAIDPGLPSASVMRSIPNVANPSMVETDWAMFSRVAAELRAWFFESEGVFWLGRPSWIVSKTRQFKVGWMNGWGGDEYYRAVTCPQWSVDRDTLPTTGMIQVQLPRTRGEQVRPGMRMNVQGMGVRDSHGPDLYDANVTEAPGYIVTKVTWPLDHGDTPVSVYAQEPVDPYPSDALFPYSAPVKAPAPALNGKAAAGTKQSIDFVNDAFTYKGAPYLLGGNSRTGIDCSGLVQQALAFVGIQAPRTSGAQFSWCQQENTIIPLSQAYNTYGALLFAPADGSDHVAISLGNGTCIEAWLMPYGVTVQPVGQGTGFIPFGSAGLVPGLVYPGGSESGAVSSSTSLQAAAQSANAAQGFQGS